MASIITDSPRAMLTMAIRMAGAERFSLLRPRIWRVIKSSKFNFAADFFTNLLILSPAQRISEK